MINMICRIWIGLTLMLLYVTSYNVYLQFGRYAFLLHTLVGT